ncbi:uncharacterized protein [Dysidea avara]|uniref:uncharacterized protein n=1 Tax=Dysidea avara TaxID=196820 RepID=UPI00332D79C5
MIYQSRVINHFKDASGYQTNVKYTFADRVISSPTNDESLQLNEIILDLLPGESRTYFSIDDIVCDHVDERAQYPDEFLNSLTPCGMPPHKLRLKVGAIAQGQTFDKVGIYMERPCFSHGKLYVAFSRARRFADVSVEIVKSMSQGRHRRGTFTSNVVYSQILN